MTRHHVRLTLEYDGGPFYGWSRQPGASTIEGALLTACARLRMDLDKLRCAGRTDAGVHASAQVVSLSYSGPVPPERLAPALSQHLPQAVSVLEVVPCAELFDARAHALSRAYEYRVLTRQARAPLRAPRVLHHPRPLSRELLDEAAALILGKHDFSAFTPSRTAHVFFHRTVLESRWERHGDELRYTIRANAFLRHMVRILMGTMLAVGRGDWDPARLAALLEGTTRDQAHQTAPPHGLCLFDVEYPPGAEQGLVPLPDHAAGGAGSGRGGSNDEGDG